MPEKKSKIVIRTYREIGGPKETEARLELPNARRVESLSKEYVDKERANRTAMKYMSKPVSRAYLSVYHLNNSTIAVTQEDTPNGWESRLFRFAGEKSNIELIVTELKEVGVKLEKH